MGDSDKTRYCIEDSIIKVSADILDKGKRADVYLCKQIGTTRSNMQKLLKNSLVSIDEKTIKQNYLLKGNETFNIEYQPPVPIDVQAENIPLDILYQDKNMIVVNKARNMVVHPAVGNYTGTLVNALLYYCNDLSGINGQIRPGIVHRLDKDTSGVMVVAKNDDAHVDLALQIQSKSAIRKYLAIVHGVVKKDQDTIKTLIARDSKDRQKMAVVEQNGREAITTYQVLERFKQHTLLSLQLYTGRTHQIRVHMSHINHPIVGDTKYMPRKHGFNISGQALHSHTLQINNMQGEKMLFTADLPDDMLKIINKLKNN